MSDGGYENAKYTSYLVRTSEPNIDKMVKMLVVLGSNSRRPATVRQIGTEREFSKNYRATLRPQCLLSLEALGGDSVLNYNKAAT